jgi:hypothetical protein
MYLADGDYAYTTDNGVVFPVDIYTSLFDGGTVRRKYLKILWAEGDQNAGSILQMRFTGDDYQTYNNFRMLDLSKNKPFLTDLGTFTTRAFHFRHQCATPFRITSISMQIDEGTL